VEKLGRAARQFGAAFTSQIRDAIDRADVSINNDDVWSANALQND
jgi:hypothetical protein